MKPERWREIEAIFDACVDLGASEREALLAQRCRDDAELRAEVETLLRHAEPADRLERIVGRSRRAAVAGSVADRRREGELVGSYRLETCLGEGGMGSVWRARREGEDFEQRVAIKFVGAARRGPDFERRFRAERQILARLEHPHIARLLGGGSTDDGEPYLVMELVEGEELLAYCRSRRLDLRQRLHLFLQVASAVEHAHRHLVVHRDLKPANILVDPESGPKLLDFGIAKMLRADGDSGLPDLTRPEQRVLTPDYASPEQVLGRPITTASDVYSLGVVLCEMLTGRRPRRLEGLTPADRERRLTESQPTRPSTLVRQGPSGDAPDASFPGDRRTLARRLRGDLDTIVLRALDSEPERRYASVAEMAADVERHLRGEPLLARPDAWSYRAGKWMRRHPWGAASTVIIALLLFSLVAGLVLHSREVAAERDRALAAQSEAHTVSEFLMHLFEVADPGESRGETVTARELLDRGGELIETSLEDEPEVQASLLSTLADVHLNLGLRQRAEELHRQALELRAEHLGPRHLETASSHNRLGDTLRQLARMDEAEEHLRRALAIRLEKLPSDDPELADTLGNLGLLLMERGEKEEAEPLLRRSLEIRVASLGDEDADTVVSRSNLGQLLMDMRRFDEAAPLLESAAASRLARLGENHPKTALSFHKLGTLRQGQGRLEEAEELLLRALRIRRQVLPPEHPALAASLNNLASLLHDQLRLDEAESFYRQALAQDRQAGTDGQIGTAYTLNNLASLLEDLGRYDEAEELYRRSLEIRLETLGVGRSSERVRSKLGRLALYQGRPEEAAAWLEASGRWTEANLDPTDTDHIRWVERMGLLRRAEGERAAAVERFEQALAAAAGPFDASHAIHAELEAELARTLAASAEPNRCLEVLESARSRPGYRDGSDVTRGRVALAAGLCLDALGRHGEAAAALREARQLIEPLLGERNVWVRRATEALSESATGRRPADTSR